MAEEQIIIREATAKDTDAIVEVLKSTRLDGDAWRGGSSFVAENLRQGYSGQFVVFVAERDGAIVGFIDCIVFASFWECQRQGLIVDFFVHPAYQSKGIGSKLLSALIEKADKENIGELHVSTGWENKKARRLYGKFGFTEEQLLLERSRTSGCSNV